MADAPRGPKKGPLWKWVLQNGSGWKCQFCGKTYGNSHTYSARIRRHLSGLPNVRRGGIEICTKISAELRNIFRQEFRIIDPAQVAAAPGAVGAAPGAVGAAPAPGGVAAGVAAAPAAVAAAPAAPPPNAVYYQDEPEDDDNSEDLSNPPVFEGLEDILGEIYEMDWQQQHAPLVQGVNQNPDEMELVQGVNQYPDEMDIIHPGGEHPHGQEEQPDQHQQGLGVQPDQHQQGLGVQGIELADIIARRDASAAVINAVTGNIYDLMSRYQQLVTGNLRINHMLNGGGPPPAPAELEQLDEAVAYIQAYFGLNL